MERQARQNPQPPPPQSFRTPPQFPRWPSRQPPPFYTPAAARTNVQEAEPKSCRRRKPTPLSASDSEGSSSGSLEPDQAGAVEESYSDSDVQIITPSKAASSFKNKRQPRADEKPPSKKKKKQQQQDISTTGDWCWNILTNMLYGALVAIIVAYLFSASSDDTTFSSSSSRSSSGGGSGGGWRYGDYNRHDYDHGEQGGPLLKLISPNPVDEFANYMERMAPFTQSIIRNGVANKERYIYFRDEVKGFCGGAKRIRKKIEADGGRSWAAMREYVDQSLAIEGKGKSKSKAKDVAGEVKKRISKQADGGSAFGNLISSVGKSKVAGAVLEGVFSSEEDKRKREMNVYERTEDNCRELLKIFDEMAGERDKFADVFELSDHLLVVWPSAASTALSEGSKILREVLSMERDKSQPRQLRDSRASGVVHLDGKDGVVVINSLGEQIRDFRVLAQACLDMMATVDRWLGKILPLSERIFHDDKVLDAYMLSDRYRGEIPKRDGWRSEIEKLQKGLNAVNARLGNLHGTQLAFERAKKRIAEGATTADGRLGRLERRFGELSTPKAWDRVEKVRGEKIVVKRYLAISEEMARDLKDRAKRVDRALYDFKYSLWGEGRKWPDVKSSGKAETRMDESQFY